MKEDNNYLKKIDKTDEAWRNQLSDLEYEVCRKKGTERAFSGKYNECKDNGIYRCVCCGLELFDSRAKFDSGTGWPSFFSPLSSEVVSEKSDNSLFMTRTEVLCTRCGSHLGHVFPDGPEPTGLRYCLNSVALTLVKSGS